MANRVEKIPQRARNLRVVVFDVPASATGALVVLKDFFEFAVTSGRKDIDWLFVVSTDALVVPQDVHNVEIVRFSWVKKGWLFRIFFEVFLASGIAKRFRADGIFSLQNTAILMSSIPQVVYVHQSIPYAARRFSYFKRDERFLALLGDLFRPMIGLSVKASVSSIVQTEWLRKAIERIHAVPAGRIHVVPQAIRFSTSGSRTNRKTGVFFYPTSPYVYKGIDQILEAVEVLAATGLNPLVKLTIDGTENRYAKKIHREIVEKGLAPHFQLLGRIPHQTVIELYRESVLLFTSRLESYGLPLLEGRLLGVPMIVTKQPFSEEILSGYSRVVFVPQGASKPLADAMRSILEAEPGVKVDYESTQAPVQYETSSAWNNVETILMRAFCGSKKPLE